ncbi:hypothetical protein BH10PSE4_BH10PSE4_24540 [soil metagenome]
MKTPDQDHPIICSREPGRVEVLFEDHQIADSDDVLLLAEADYPVVRYFPRADVAMAFLQRTDKVTHCPYKGDATYYTITRDRQVIENAVWSYETPFPALSQIAGRLAFYPQHVTFKVAGHAPAQTGVLDVDDVVRHTDSGSGASQAEHWPPNVDMPDDEAWEGDEVKNDDGRETPVQP